MDSVVRKKVVEIGQMICGGTILAAVIILLIFLVIVALIVGGAILTVRRLRPKHEGQPTNAPSAPTP